MDFSSYLFSCLIKIMLYLFGGHPGDAYYFCNIQFFNATQCKHSASFRRQIPVKRRIKSCNSLLTKASFSMFLSDFQFHSPEQNRMRKPKANVARHANGHIVLQVILYTSRYSKPASSVILVQRKPDFDLEYFLHHIPALSSLQSKRKVSLKYHRLKFRNQLERKQSYRSVCYGQ